MPKTKTRIKYACKPSDIVKALMIEGLTIGEGKEPEDGIATDTETSGLFADDGARISTASVAWVDKTGEWREWAERFDNVTYGKEEIAPGYEVLIVSIAWPFDQGTVGKPESLGEMLWPEADNLPVEEFTALLELLSMYYLDMHHSKFDSEKYRVGVRLWPGVGVELQHLVKWDSQNVNDLFWRLHPTSLKPTCARIFGKAWADEAAVVKKYLAKAKLPSGRWDLMPWDAIGKYADTDARITKMLCLRQAWEIENGDPASWLYEKEKNCSALDDQETVMRFIQRRLDVTGVLYRMERRGVFYDEVTSRLAGDECLKRAEPLAAKLPFEPPTLEKAKAFFFTEGRTSKGVEHLDRVPYSVTEKGSPQLTAEITTRMVADRVPHAQDWAEYNRVTNAASMWYHGYADKMGTDGRLRCAFRQNGTVSTRFSVERVNLQAIPQDYRLSDPILEGILTPRQIMANAVPEGWRNYELDLEQAELRVGAMFAKCVRMLEMIANGEDLHTYTTRELFPQIEFKGPQWAEYRQVGKRGNFSLQFGSKGETFRKMVSKETGIILEPKQADIIVRDWNGLYPEYDRAIKRHQHVVEKRQSKFGYAWIDLVNGERRWFQQYEEAHKAFNQRVQANLAQFAIDWLLMTEPFLAESKELQKRAARDKIGEPGLVLTIHDSQVLLLPDDDFGQSLAQQCADFGVELWKKMFPDVPGGVDFHAWDRVEVP